MKRRKRLYSDNYVAAKQQLLIHDNTEEEYIKVSENNIIDRHMIAFYCNVHNLFYWRNVMTNKGRCSKCFEQFNTNKIQLFHIPQHKITSEKWKIIDQRNLQNLYSVTTTTNSDTYKIGSDLMTFVEKKGAEIIEWETKGQEIVGKLTDKKEHIGENDSTLYIIEKANGDKVGVWESGFLAQPMSEIRIGATIKIIYDGLGKPKQKGFNAPKLFRVFEDK